MVWQKGTGHASFNLQIADGQADLQLCFKLGRPEDQHLSLPSQRTRAKGPRQKERDRARAAAHHAKQSADSADTGSGQIAAETSEVATETSTGTPVLDVPPHPPPGLDGVGRRPSTRSTTVPVKMKLAAFARSAAEMALKETLPKFIPGFDQNIEFFMKECDFGDGEERRYFNKYTSMFVFGFHLDKDLVTPELLKQMKMKWVEKDKYWDHRPSEVIDIII